jgi:DNA-directed RNA polymerase specialized sigma24 family protein
MQKVHTSTKILELPPPKSDGKYTFDELIDIVQEEIDKYHTRWNLHAISWMDWDDVRSILFEHIFLKFDKWNQARPFFPYIHTIIRNQMKNLWRDKYYTYQKPCVRCAVYDSFTDNCGIYGSPCRSCPLYKKWIDTKKNEACNVKLPVSISDERILPQIEEIQEEYYDLQNGVNKFHERMKQALTPAQYKIYNYKFIMDLNDWEISEKMGYKKTNHSDSNERAPGYRWLAMIVKEIKEKARQVVEIYGAE